MGGPFPKTTEEWNVSEKGLFIKASAADRPQVSHLAGEVGLGSCCRSWWLGVFRRSSQAPATIVARYQVPRSPYSVARYHIYFILALVSLMSH